MATDKPIRRFSERTTLDPDEKTHLAQSILGDASDPSDAPIMPVEALSIEPADNGYAVTTHHRPPRGKDGQLGYNPPKKHVYPDKQRVAEHILKVLR